MPVLENESLRIEIDAETGAIRQVTNRLRGIELITAPAAAPPWRLERDGHIWIDAFDTFAIDEGERELRLRWTTGEYTIGATITLTDVIEIRVSARPENGQVVDKIEYPVISGIGALHDVADSYLAHPQGTGFRFRNPHTLFTEEKPGIRWSPYPEGFSGSSLQAFAYYADRIGGFDFATHDAGGAMKWLNCWKADDDALRISFMHQSPDVRPGNGYAPSYSVRIGALTEGTWYEAADRYKAWALQQPWASRGPIAERPTWLHTDVGIATFGVNAAHDRAAWLRHFHDIAGTPVFHILGVNWPRQGGDYRGHHPGGRADWFPARFAPENLAAIREQDDYWAPFEFDLLQDPDGIDKAQIEPALVTFQEEKYSFDAYAFPFHCPTVPYFRDLHAWRDTMHVTGHDVDAVYYDISANNVTMQCRSGEHGHPVGGGEWMVDAYRRLWQETGEAASAVKGSPVLQGAEMVNEVFLDRLDYYQARAEAAPLSPFESNFFRDWIIAGECEKIPLFTYVYHEVGPVRLDGWAKLAADTGELWYWVAARIALWGGLFELNYEFSPLEVLAGVMEDTTEHYAEIDDVPRELDPAREAFVAELARARVGFARDFLVYGTMRPPLEIDSPKVDLDWHLYNFNPQSPIYDQRGVMAVDQVVHAAWRAPDGRMGFAFLNLDAESPVDITARLSRDRYGLPPRAEIAQVTGTTNRVLFAGQMPAELDLTVTFPPRMLTLLIVTAAS